jgi:hypothetical protein
MDKLIDYEGLGTFQTNLLNDNKISPIATWSSEKISDELASKANISDLSSYATISYVTGELATKANLSDLSSYATISYVTNGLAGKQNTLTAGSNVSITGNNISAIGYRFDSSKNSIAIGTNTTASGSNSHAEGKNTTASDEETHAEGVDSTASGNFSHAEGARTTSSGKASHTEGWMTSAQNTGEHAEGMYNISHRQTLGDGSYGNTIHSIGVGSANIYRQNAVEVMQNGDMYVLGVGGYQGTNTKVQDTTIKTLQEYIASLEARIAALEHPTTTE